MTQAPTADQAAASPRRGHSNPYVVLGVVLTASFMQLVDVSIVNVAIPSIQRDLSTSYSDVQFVIIGYTLAFATLLITSARLGDLYDRRRVFLGGMALFAIASALCGAAGSPGMLIAARVLQGLGGALMFPQVLAIIQVVFPPQERGKAFSVLGATIGIATITGPLIGGLLLAWDPAGLQWRSIFYVNIPVAAVALVLGFRYLPSSRNEHAVGLDLGGVVLSTAGLLAIVYPLTVGREKGWPAWTWITIVAGVVLMVLFLLYERRLTNAGGSPLVPSSVLADHAFRPGLALGLVFFAGLAPFFFALSLYLQIGFGFTPLHSGLTTVPFAVGSGFASAASNRISKRLGRTVLVLGAAILVVAMLLLSLVVREIDTALASWKLWPVLILGGVGLGLFVAPFLNLVLAGVQPRNAGPASGVLSTAQQIGGSIGVALIGIVLFGLLGANAALAAAKTEPVLRQSLTAAGVPASAQDQVVAASARCFEDRAKSSDPSVVPPSCTPATPPSPQVSAALASSGATALEHDFAKSFSETLWYQAGLFLVSLLLVLRLPKRRPGEGAPSEQPVVDAAV